MEVVRRCCFQMAVCHRKFMGATSAVSYMFACSTTTNLSCQYMFLRIDQLDTPWHCLQSCLPYVRGAPRWLGVSCGIWPHKKVWVLIVIGDLVSLWPAKSRWSRVPRGERMAMLDHVSRCQGGKIIVRSLYIIRWVHMRLSCETPLTVLFRLTIFCDCK